VRRMSETERKKRVALSKFCDAKHHSARDAGEIQTIASDAALENLRNYRYLADGTEHDFSHLKLGSSICASCRKEALRERDTRSEREGGAKSPTTRSPARESFLLIATSPIAAEDAARALAASPVALSDVRFAEFEDSHPWAWLGPQSVLANIRAIPELTPFLEAVPPSRLREVISGFGKLVWTECATLQRVLERADREARNLKTLLAERSAAETWRVVEKELTGFMVALRDLRPFEKGTWARAQEVFASDSCGSLRNLLGVLVNVKGAASRNVVGGRQSKDVKLRKVCLVLLQLCRLRSERFSLFALKFSTYLHFRSVPEAVAVLEIQLGLGVDPKTRREALDMWRTKNACQRVMQVLAETPEQVAFVGDNVNVFRGVRDFGGELRGRQMNLFAVAFFRRAMPSPALSRTCPEPCQLSTFALALDGPGYGRMKEMLRWALHGVLLSYGADGLPDVAERPHQQQPCSTTEWVPITMTAHDSSRPAEVWEVLKSLVARLQLGKERVWPFYGDMLTCKYVTIASSVYEKDAFDARQFRAEIGLFHAQMHTVQKVLWVHFNKDLLDAAKRLGFEKVVYEPYKNYNVFERICSGLLVAVAVAVWRDKKQNFDAAVDRVWNSLQRQGETVGDDTGRLLGFLLLNCSWKRLVKLADGEGMFDLIRFLLPFLATLKSNMYFSFLTGWVRETLSMSPFDRTLRLQNLFVNRRGEPGHAREVDLEFEYLVCGIKRMAQALPNPTPEQLQQMVQDFPLFEQLREEVDVEFKPAKNSTSRSVRKNCSAINEVAKWYDGRSLGEGQRYKAVNVKDAPLLFAFSKFHKKIGKMIAAIPRKADEPLGEKDKAAGDEEMTAIPALDEYEQAFLNE
jgi:hypothetical protein